MEREIVSFVETGVGASAVGHYNSFLEQVQLPSEAVAKLRLIASRNSNDCVANATPLSVAVAQEANVLIDGAGCLSRVGPVVGIHLQQITPAAKFTVENFFGLPRRSRHTGPNKVFINPGATPIGLEVSRSGLRAYLGDEPSEEKLRGLITAGPSLIEISHGAVTQFTISANEAVIVPVEMTPYRFTSAGEVLVLHGFFCTEETDA